MGFDAYSMAMNAYDLIQDLPCQYSSSVSSAIPGQKRRVLFPLALAGILLSLNEQGHAVW